MMNVLSLGLVLTTMVAGALWTPPPVQHDHREVIVKEGHRVVVVEYEKEGDGNTKVLISPQEPYGVDVKTSTLDAAVGDAGGMFSGPRELVCDAFGKCKHKLANALGRTKEKVTETAQEASGKVQDMEEQAKESAGDAIGKAKQMGQDLGKATGKLTEKASEKVKGTQEKATRSTIGESIDKAKKVAKDMMDTVRDAAVKTADFDVVDSPKRIGEDIQGNITGKLEDGPVHTMEQAKEHVVENAKQIGNKSLGEILLKLQDLTYDLLWYVVSPERLDAVVGLIHMLGFSTAYGMCVWVTFVSSYILGRYLPRQQFGMVQSRIYTVYFRAMAYCVGAAFLGHLVSQRTVMITSMMEMFQGFSLLSALFMVLTNMICLEPKATKLMFERIKIEKEEGRGLSGTAMKHGVLDDINTVERPMTCEVTERQSVLRMNEKLKKLNTCSSALNVSTLVVLTWHMAYMGQRLQATR